MAFQEPGWVVAVGEEAVLDDADRIRLGAGETTAAWSTAAS
ncbi:hypothetical protein ABZ891_23380 [Streptomyces sp. NPDC047023]